MVLPLVLILLWSRSGGHSTDPNAEEGLRADLGTRIGHQEASNEVGLQGEHPVAGSRTAGFGIHLVGPGWLSDHRIHARVVLVEGAQDSELELDLVLGANDIESGGSVISVKDVRISGRHCRFQLSVGSPRSLTLTLEGWSDLYLAAFNSVTGAGLPLGDSVVRPSLRESSDEASEAFLLSPLPTDALRLLEDRFGEGRIFQDAKIGVARAPESPISLIFESEGFRPQSFSPRPWQTLVCLSLQPEGALVLYGDGVAQLLERISQPMAVYVVPVGRDVYLDSYYMACEDLKPDEQGDLYIQPQHFGQCSVQIRTRSQLGPGALVAEEVVYLNPGESRRLEIGLNDVWEPVLGALEVMVPTGGAHGPCSYTSDHTLRVSYELVSPSGAKMTHSHFEQFEAWILREDAGSWTMQWDSLAAVKYRLRILGASLEEVVHVSPDQVNPVFLPGILERPVSVFLAENCIESHQHVTLSWGLAPDRGHQAEASRFFVGPGPHQVCLPSTAVWVQAMTTNGATPRIPFDPAELPDRGRIDLELQPTQGCSLILRPKNAYTASLNSVASLEPQNPSSSPQFVAMHYLLEGSEESQGMTGLGGDAAMYVFDSPGLYQGRILGRGGESSFHALDLAAGENVALVDALSGTIELLESR